MRSKLLLRLLFTVVLITFFASLHAQEKPVLSGTVYNEFKKPVKGAKVYNAYNTLSAISDGKGHFTVTGLPGDKLRISHPDRATKEIVAKDATGINFYFDNQKKIDEEKKRLAEKLERKQKRKAERQYQKQQRIASRESSKRSAMSAAAPITGFSRAVSHDKKRNPYSGSVIGQVTDEYDIGLPGATVQVRGDHAKAVTTDIDGYYAINAKGGDVLVYSFIGYNTREISATPGIMNIQMQPDAGTLDEVIVVGYGTTTKEAFTGTAIKIRGASSVASESSASSSAVGIEKGVASDKSVKPAKEKDSLEKAGQLTAGEVNDFSKWEYWEDLSKDELSQWKMQWQVAPGFRYSVVLKNAQGFPLVNKLLNLIEEGTTVIWTARTDNTGRAELWYKPGEPELVRVDANITITDANNKTVVTAPKEFRDGINTAVYNEACNVPDKINIAFMVDATGSMGDEITYLQGELYDVIQRTKDALPDATLRMGSVFYRDQGDEYVTRNFDFTDNVSNVMDFIKNQRAGGGGDYPEAVIEALTASVNELKWDDDARAKLLFVMLDAPPHLTPENLIRLQVLAKAAAAKGIRIIPLAASGIDKSTEYLMRALALETNGTYLFITNHSGIGNDHIAPSTDSYEVEMLNDLLVRIILQNTTMADCSKSQNLQGNTQFDNRIATTGALKFSCYPNPTSGPLTIEVHDEAKALYLFDTTGKLLLYRNEEATEYSLDLSSLPDAVYYVKVILEGKELMGKIIKRG